MAVIFRKVVQLWMTEVLTAKPVVSIKTKMEKNNLGNCVLNAINMLPIILCEHLKSTQLSFHFHVFRTKHLLYNKV